MKPQTGRLTEAVGLILNSALSFQLSLLRGKYSKAQRRDFYDQLLKRLELAPGVVAAGAINILPMSNNNINTSFEIVGRPPFEKGKGPGAEYRVVTPGYFDAIGMSAPRGRGFTSSDTEQSPGVVIINEAFAHRFFPDQQPIGQRITHIDEADKPREIVGVVGDVKDTELDMTPMPRVYLPHAQDPVADMGVVLRAAAEPTTLTDTARGEVMKLDPAQPLSNVMTVDRMIRERTAPKRVMTAMMGVFAGIALLLAAVGLCAVMAYAVSQRTHEIGVRMALGAQSRDIVRLITGQGLKLTLAGLALGTVGAFALTRVMAPLLYGVTATDPLTFILISLALAGAALLACWIPARQATKVDPMIALRRE
jgi:putative ABC transport system permease protein